MEQAPAESLADELARANAIAAEMAGRLDDDVDDAVDDDSWGAADDVQARDLAQSDNEGEARERAEDEALRRAEVEAAMADAWLPPAAPASAGAGAAPPADAAEGWVTEDSYEHWAKDGSDGEDDEGASSRARRFNAEHDEADDADRLARNLLDLERRMLKFDTVKALEVRNAELERLLAERDRELAELRKKHSAQLVAQDDKLNRMRAAQLELLQSMAILKRSFRAFQDGILSVVDALPAEAAASHLSEVVGELVKRTQIQIAKAEEREAAESDADILEMHLHPIEKLMRLTHNVNPQEASFLLVRFFCRLDHHFAAPGAPATAVMLEKAFRFWDITQEFVLYPLYSAVCTHFHTRLQRVAESTPHLLYATTGLCLLFYNYRSEFDPSESTDVVSVRNMNQVILGLFAGEDELSQGAGTRVYGAAVNPSRPDRGTKLIVKTKRAFWVELRNLIVRAFVMVLRNEGDFVEACVRTTLDQIRTFDVNGELRYDSADRCSEGMVRMLNHLDELVVLMRNAYTPRAIAVQLIAQLCGGINAHLCNSLMLRKSYASMLAANAFRADLLKLDEWLEQYIVPDCVGWVKKRLAPIREMIDVLFMKKAQLRQPEIRASVCPTLTVHQLLQLLTSYAPRPGEEAVPLTLIQSLLEESTISPKKSYQAELQSVLFDLTVVAPIDLSVVKENWISRIPLKSFKETPFPAVIMQDYIMYRNKLRQQQERELKREEEEAAAKKAAKAKALDRYSPPPGAKPMDWEAKGREQRQQRIQGGHL